MTPEGHTSFHVCSQTTKKKKSVSQFSFVLNLQEIHFVDICLLSQVHDFNFLLVALKLPGDFYVNIQVRKH